MSESRSPHEDIVGSSEVDPDDIRRFLKATKKDEVVHAPGPAANLAETAEERAEATTEPEISEDYYQHQLEQLRKLRREREDGESTDDDTQQ